MSADPRFEQVRSLLQANRFMDALAKVHEIETSGLDAPEVEFYKGLCFAGMGRISEARVIARRLKQEGHVALAQRLAEHITVEEPPEGLIDDAPRPSVIPPYPTVSAPSKVPRIAALAVGAVLVLAVGVVVGSRLSRPAPNHESTPTTDAVAKESLPVPVKAQPATRRDVSSTDLTGDWITLDFVQRIDRFKPGQKQFRGDLYIKHVEFSSNGKSTTSMDWKDGEVVDVASGIRAPYSLKDIGGVTYLFLPWLSGDVTERHNEPWFYVLKKSDAQQSDPLKGEAPQVQVAAQQSTIQWQQGTADITGTWQSVDFVRDPAEFVPGKRLWQGDLFLKGMDCYADGSSSTNITWGGGWITDINSGYKAQYDVWIANGVAYLFFPWISGDVTIRGEKPQYYVLQLAQAR